MTYECKFPKIAAALYVALLEDAFYYTLEASAPAETSRDAMIHYLDYSLVEAETHGVLSLADAGKLGAAAWSKPVDAELGASIAEQKKAFIADVMGEACLDTYTDITTSMHNATQPFISEESWYLSIIGVSPQAQGRGVGRMMMEEVLLCSDAAGVPTYLETFTLRNKRFYERLGYDEVAVIHEPCTAASYAVMVRQPRRG